VAAGIATITLASPQTRNRLTTDTITQLTSSLERAREDGVRVVVLTAQGGTFCAGADLAAASSGEGNSFADSAPSRLAALLEAMLTHPCPIVARVQGHVAGGGNGLVAAADLSVAVESARFAFSEVRLGVAPAVVSVVCLARMNPRDARELLLTGERVSAVRAQQAGLVTTVVEDAALDAAVDGYVQALLAGGPLALARTKELLARVPSMPRSEAFAWTAQLSASLFAGDEAREGMAAFLERRRPAWAPADGG
jgi:methylglutaconyl-CoA hydratase